MAKRERPARVPTGIQLVVAERQLGTRPDPATTNYLLARSWWKHENGREMPDGLSLKLALGILFGDAVVNLDHTWALIDRPYNPRIKNVAARYTPNANNPDYMEWRPKARDVERSHDIKTFVRGDNGQLSDIGLRNKQRRMDRNRGIIKSKRPKVKIKSRGFQKPHTKQKWASRPFKRKK